MESKSRFITSTGREIRVLPISQITVSRIRASVVDRFEKSGKRLRPPTYTVTDVAGTQETFPHTYETIEYPTVTEEERTQWNEYLTDIAAMDNEIKSKVTQYLYLSGLSVAEDNTPEYLEMCAFFNIPVPESRMEAKFQYIVEHVLPTAKDKTDAMLRILQVSGVESEVVKAVEDSFRGIPDEREAESTSEVSPDVQGQMEK